MHDVQVQLNMYLLKKLLFRADQDQFKDVDDWMAHGIDVYHLRKFQGSSYSTWIHQTPIVNVGDRVRSGDMLD